MTKISNKLVKFIRQLIVAEIVCNWNVSLSVTYVVTCHFVFILKPFSEKCVNQKVCIASVHYPQPSEPVTLRAARHKMAFCVDVTLNT